MIGEEEHFASLTKFYTLVMLNEGSKHGYEIMGELEKRLGKKPSPGQIYPLLQKFEKNGLVRHKVVKTGGREKKIYTLTGVGKATAAKMTRRFGEVISIILEPKLTKCAHCGCKVYEGGYKEKIDGKVLMFCCVHCANSYKHVEFSWATDGGTNRR